MEASSLWERSEKPVVIDAPGQSKADGERVNNKLPAAAQHLVAGNYFLNGKLACASRD